MHLLILTGFVILVISTVLRKLNNYFSDRCAVFDKMRRQSISFFQDLSVKTFIRDDVVHFNK